MKPLMKPKLFRAKRFIISLVPKNAKCSINEVKIVKYLCFWKVNGMAIAWLKVFQK